MNGAKHRKVVIWDFDGTLVDSHPKNLNVNRRILQRLTGRSPDAFPALTSLRSYERAVARAGNWRDFYARELGLHAADIEEAGRMWPGLLQSDPTPHVPFDGVAEALEELDDMPHGILSQNDSGVIRDALETSGLAAYFSLIIGHGELEPAHQKPAGDGLLQSIEALGVSEPGHVFFVGDHVTDAMCVANARCTLHETGRAHAIHCIAARFGEFDGEAWSVDPDHVAKTPADVVRLVRTRTEG